LIPLGKLKRVLFIALLVVFACEEKEQHGCLDSQACNYNSEATIENNSCEYIDNCGVCDADTTNDCVQDCADVWGGNAVEDSCGTCDSDSANDCVIDCSGDWGGSAFYDSCGICVSDTPHYIEFADEHWDFNRWVRNTPLSRWNWENDYQIPDIWNSDLDDSLMYDIIISGTHSMNVLYNGQIKSSECFYDSGDCVDFIDYQDNDYALLDSMEVIRDCNFYRNIGRYDQFVGGWDDLVDADSSSIWWIKEEMSEDGYYYVLIMTNNKQEYLNLRQEYPPN
jgi:hypothetical protein